MAKPGSGKRQMQAIINKRNNKAKASTNIIYKFLTAIVTFVVLMFKYIFIALWWLVKQLFKMMYVMLSYIYRGIVLLAKKAAAKLRKQKENE